MTTTARTTEQATRPLRVVFVAAHDSLGGAARAVFRVFSAIATHCSDRMDITFRVIHKTRDHPKIIGGKPQRSRFQYWQYFVRTRFRKYFPRATFLSPNKLLHSQALFPTGMAREINSMKPDVVLLGWLGNATISIPEIAQIEAPVVWRLSDMWMFSGAEHYTDTKRYVHGYSRASRPADEHGPDINRETFRRKKRHWRTPRHVIALTQWLAGEARSSTLTRHWPIHVIPVPMDTDFWAPIDKADARQQLGIPADDLVVMFGAGSGTKYQHKGADLLFDALPTLKEMHDQSGDSRRLRAMVFGQDGAGELVGDIPLSYLGRLDDEQLRLAYAAADVFVAPSRLEAFGQVAAEAQCCGTPVVAFDNSGLTDVVADRETGRLATAFDPDSLAEAIYWVLSDEHRLHEMGHAARERAVTLWNPRTIAEQYALVLEMAAGNKAD